MKCESVYPGLCRCARASVRGIIPKGGGREEKSPFEDRSELEEMTLVNLPKIFDQTEEVRCLTDNRALTFPP